MYSHESERIYVDLTQDWESAHPDVKNVVSGFAYLSAALISVGYEEVVTPSPGRGLESLVPTLNKGLSDTEVAARLKSKHPNIGQLVLELDKYGSGDEYDKFISYSGALDMLFELEQVETQPNHYTFAIKSYF